MLKHVVFTAALTVSAPALSQQAAPTTTSDQITSATTPSGPATTAPAQAPGGATMQTADTTATPAAGGGSVSSIIDSEFAGYDKDGSGSLSRAEFAAWMDALKAKADANAKPDAGYNTAAFKQADVDRSRSVTKEELTSFLGGSGRSPS